MWHAEKEEEEGKRRRRKEWKNNGKKCLPFSIIYYQCLCLGALLFMLCFTFSFVNIKYKWAFHRIFYRTRRYTIHCTQTHIYNKGGIWHSFLKYKWGVNNVMMLSCSIYSYMICWLGFYLYGQQFYTTLIWERVSYYVYVHNCGTLFFSSRCSNPFSWDLSTMRMHKSHL